jgi:hypothetical protein
LLPVWVAGDLAGTFLPVTTCGKLELACFPNGLGILPSSSRGGSQETRAGEDELNAGLLNPSVFKAFGGITSRPPAARFLVGLVFNIAKAFPGFTWLKSDPGLLDPLSVSAKLFSFS